VLADSATVNVTDNAGQNRFELWLNGDLVGILGYFEVDPGRGPRTGRPVVVSFMHTVITEDFGHRGLASVIVKGSLERARAYGWKVKPVCSYVRRYLAENPGYRDVVIAV